MAFLQSEDFRETYFDASDLTDYPTSRLEVGQKIITVLPGDGDAKMPEIPFIALVATDTTFPGLVNSEHVLAWKRDETNPDKYHIVRDWNYYTNLEPEIIGAINNPPDGYVEGDDTITTSGLVGVVEWNYIRIGIDPQMYRVTNVAGNDLTLEPALLRDVANSEIVRVVADHFRAGTANPVSRERVHSDHEKIIILQVKIHLEEIQDAISQLQDLAYPDDLVADTLTLTNHVSIGDVKAGYPDAVGMIKYAGGHFQGYDGAEWKNLDESGGGATLPGGTDGQIIRYSSGWEATSLLEVHDSYVQINYGVNIRFDAIGMAVDGDIAAQRVEAQTLYGNFGLFDNTNLLEAPTQGLFLGHGDLYPGFAKFSVIASANNLDITNEDDTIQFRGLLILSGSGDPQTSDELYSGLWKHKGYLTLSAEEVPAFPGEAILSLNGQTGVTIQSKSPAETFIFADGANDRIVFYKDITFDGEYKLYMDNDSYIEFVGRDSYPPAPANGTMIYHDTDGFRVFQGGVWNPIVGDDLEFTAPGDPWSTLVWDPTADGGAGDWVYTNELLIEPIGVRIEKALIIGERDPEMPEEVGLIEYTNGDFQGIVEGPDGQGTLRVSLTNISPEQRLPAADLLAGAFMYAAQDGLGRWVWKSTGVLNWEVNDSRLAAPEIRVGEGAGTEGVIRWNAGEAKLEWSDGVTWYSWEQDAIIPAPTILGAFMYVGGTEESKNWEETTAIAIIDNKLVTATLEVQTIRLGPDGGGEYHEFNADALAFNSMSIHQMTGVIQDEVEPNIDFSEGWAVFKTLSADVINVNTLNLISEEENPLSFQMERLVIVDSEPNSVRYVWDSAEFITGQEELRLIHDDLDPYIGFYQEVTETYEGETVGEHDIGETEISVTNMGATIEAGTRVTIGNYTYRVSSTSGIPTATIIIPSPGLKELIATGSTVTVKYGGLIAHAYGNLTVDYDLKVKARAIFDYTIKLNNINDLDGELDGAPDEPGMVRYNGDFQGRLANGQWASFTRTLMDGNTDGDWGSALWWRGDQWAKNIGIDFNEDGAMRLQPDTETAAVPGAIRFTGTDFQGCINIGVWQTLTALETLPVLPSGAGYDNATLRWSNDNWVVNPYLWSDGVKSGVALLEIGAYEDFYDAGYVINTGGYSIGATIIYHEGFSGPLSVGTEIVFDGHAEVYEVDEIIDANRIRLDHGLVDNVADREWFRVQGVLPRPVAQGGQIRYNQNDFEGFIEGVGWASFTGHRSWLPNRLGDTLLNPGNLLYFSGQEWVADHSSYLSEYVFTLDKDMEVMGDLGVAGSASFNGIHVGSPLTYSHARLDGSAYAPGVDNVNVTAASRAMKNGDQFYFSNDQTQLYTMVNVVKVGGFPTQIYFSPVLVTGLTGAETITTYLPQETWISGEEIINDPTPYPGFIYFNAGRARFRGCLSSTDTPEAPAWVDLVSPIQMVNPPVMGQTLFYNKEADYWHNTSSLLIDGGIIGDDTYYSGWIRSELPLHVMDWQFLTELIPYQGDEADEYNQFLLGFEADPGEVPADPPLVMHTTSELGNVASAFFVNSTNFLAPKIILGSGLSAPLLASDVISFPAGYELIVYGQSYLDGGVRVNSGNFVIAEGRLNVQEGNVFIDKGDLILGLGSLEAQDVYAGGVGYFGQYVRVGYTETNGYLPVGAIRYSHPDKQSRGDWEGWDGEQWVSFTAGFHGQAIWEPAGLDKDGCVPFFDASFLGGKYTIIEDFKYDAVERQLTSDRVVLERLDVVAQVSDTPSEGRLYNDGSTLLYCQNGVDWVDLLRPGSSGLPNADTEGEVLKWDSVAGEYMVSDTIRVLNDQFLVNEVMVLIDYGELVPPAAIGGQIRYNQNDFEGYINGIGWVSFTGDRPMQDPTQHTGEFLFSNGEHWVANDRFKVTEVEEGDGDWNNYSIGDADTDGAIGGRWEINAFMVQDGLWIQGEHDPTFYSLSVGMLQLKTSRVEVYEKYQTGDANPSWSQIMLGYNAASHDLNALFYDETNKSFITTDLLWFDYDPEHPTTPYVVAATNLDIRSGYLNFGDSLVDAAYWQLSSTYGTDQFDFRLVGEEDVTDVYYTYQDEVADDVMPISTASSYIVYYKGDVYMFSKTDGNVYKSTDNGDTWSALGVRDNFGTVVSELCIITYDKTSISSPRDGENALMYMIGGYTGAAATNKVYTSSNGLNWTLLPNTLPSARLRCKAVVKNDGLGITVIEGGTSIASSFAPICYRTNDAITWSSVASTRDAIEIASHWVHNNIIYAALGWDGDPWSPTYTIIKSEDDGETWDTVTVLDWPENESGYLNTDSLFAIVGNRLWMLTGYWKGGSNLVHNRTYWAELPSSGAADDFVFTEGPRLNMIGYELSGVQTIWSDDELRFPFWSLNTAENKHLRWFTSTATEYVVSTGQFIMASKPLNKLLLNRPGGTVDIYGDLTLYDHNAVFKQDLLIERDFAVNDLSQFGLVAGEYVISLAQTYATFEVPVTIGTAMVSQDLQVYGKITATELDVDVVDHTVDDLMARHYIGFGQDIDSSHAWFGAVRYTGAIPVQIREDAIGGATTIKLKGVPDTVPTTVLSEERISFQNNPGRFQVTSAVDQGGGDWDIVISPGLAQGVAIDDQANLLIPGDWEGWDGSQWISFTRDVGGVGGGELPDGTSDGDALRWNLGLGEWESTTVLTINEGATPGIDVLGGINVANGKGVFITDLDFSLGGEGFKISNITRAAPDADGNFTCFRAQNIANTTGGGLGAVKGISLSGLSSSNSLVYGIEITTLTGSSADNTYGIWLNSGRFFHSTSAGRIDFCGGYAGASDTNFTMRPDIGLVWLEAEDDLTLISNDIMNIKATDHVDFNGTGYIEFNMDIEPMGSGVTNKLWKHTFNVWTDLMPGSPSPAQVSITPSGNFNGAVRGYAFDAATREYGFLQVQLPEDYQGQDLQVILTWTAAAAGSGNVVRWRVRSGAFGDNQSFDVALSDYGVIDDTYLGQYKIHKVTSIHLTPATAAAGGYLILGIDRQADSASDTFTSDALLLSVTVQY